MTTPESRANRVYYATAVVVALSLMTLGPWIGAAIGGLTALAFVVFTSSAHPFCWLFLGWASGSVVGIVLSGRALVQKVINS